MLEEPFPPVEQRLKRFLQERYLVDPADIALIRLTGDASVRQYFRLSLGDRESYVLAAYPEPFDPDSFPYQEIYELLCEIGVPVPKNIAMDGGLGLVLQEDLGDTLLLDELKQIERCRKWRWLSAAIDHIVKIQVQGSAALKPHCSAYQLAFDREKLVWELRFFHNHYLGGFSQAPRRDEAGLFSEYERLSAELADFPRVLCHRDFHVRNLMVKQDVLYVIDFQDARWGPPAYDLVSLLKDSLDLGEETVDELREYYLGEIRRRGCPGIPSEVLVRSNFLRQFHLTCIQRLLKALGTYGFQAAVRQKSVYAQYIDGTLRRALLSLHEIPEFPKLRLMLEEELSRRTTLCG